MNLDEMIVCYYNHVCYGAVIESDIIIKKLSENNIPLEKNKFAEWYYKWIKKFQQ